MTTATPPPGIKPTIIPEPERDVAGAVIYPCTDGLPMSWNTIHFAWITFLKLGLELFFADREDVFVAGDLLWYPVEGRSDIRVGPDVFVAFGRPKGERSSYMQWEEGGIAPQVVFEILSPGNTVKEMVAKQAFYARHGVQEYIMFDSVEGTLDVWVRNGKGMAPVEDTQGWRSPLLELTFWVGEGNKLHVILPDGSAMRSTKEIEAQRKEAEAGRKEEEAARLSAEARLAELAAKLRELGVDPDKV